MRKVNLIIIILLLIEPQATSFSQVVTFLKKIEAEAMPGFVFHGDFEKDMDGNYLGTCVSEDSSSFKAQAVKFNEMGEPIWNQYYFKNYYLTNISAAIDGKNNYYLAGRLHKEIGFEKAVSYIFLTKVKPENGEIVFSYFFKDTLAEFGQSKIEIYDDSCYISGTIYMNDSVSFYAIKTDLDGNFVMGRKFQTPYGAIFYSSKIDAYGNLYISGTGKLLSENYTQIIKINRNLSIVWFRAYYQQGFSDFEPVETTILKNEDVIFTGRKDVKNRLWDIALLKINKFGDYIWGRTFGDYNWDEGYCTLERPNGDLLVICEPESYLGSSQIGLLSLSKFGDLKWMKIFNSTDYGFPYKAQFNAKKGLMIFCKDQTWGNPGKLLILNTDRNFQGACDEKYVNPFIENFQVDFKSSITSSPIQLEKRIVYIIENTNSVTEVICEKTYCEPEEPYIPNIVTINNNNLNEIWKFAIDCDTKFKTRVYNRWGNLVFSSEENQVEWDCKINGNYVSPGTYFYVIDNGNYNYKGTLSIFLKSKRKRTYTESYPIKFAAIYSRFIRAIFSREIPLGHSTSHAPVLVQFPKPSSSIFATIFITRSLASTLPCGKSDNCETLADTNNMADEFLHAATQAPQPMHAAALNALSASSLGIGMLLASTEFPVFTEINPPAEMIRSKAERSTAKSFITGKAEARQGSTTIVSPSLNERMCNWQVVTPCKGP